MARSVGEVYVTVLADTDRFADSVTRKLAEHASTLRYEQLPAALVDPFIAEPTLVEHTTPTAPTIALPSFTAVAPVATAPAKVSLSPGAT